MLNNIMIRGLLILTLAQICALNFATRVRTVELGAAEVAVPSSPSMR